MKRIFTIQILIFAFIFLGGIASNNINAQCETWDNPSDSPAFNDFNRIFFGAPCATDGVCETNQIEDFEVYASEAYRINFFRKGGVYSFSMCNGPGAGTWVPEFTIIAPSGAIDAFGIGDGDSCTITWTASEDGEYFIAINEEGFCGGGENTSTSNGFPAISCISDAPCATVDTLIQCYEWASHDGPRGYGNFDSEFGGAPCDDGSGCQTYTLDIEAWASEAYTMQNIQKGGEYSFNICDGPGAGSWLPDFTIIAPNGDVDASGTDVDSCTITWTASLSGTYLIVINELGFCNGGDNLTVNNGFPSITCSGGTECDSTMLVTCKPGSIISELNPIICGDTDVFEIELVGTMAPDSGGIGILFIPREGASGGPANSFSLSGTSTNPSFDSGLNGILANNELEPLAGLWEISLFTYENGDSVATTVCSFTNESINAFFNPNLTISTEDLGSGSAKVSPSGGTSPYTFVWSDSDASATETVEGLADGDYTVTVTDDKGCTAEGSVSIGTSSVSNQKSIQDISITPNPTSGQLWINVHQLDVNVKLMDINGRVLTTNKYRSSAGNVMLDLSDYSNGVYFVNIKTENEMVNRKIILAK